MHAARGRRSRCRQVHQKSDSAQSACAVGHAHRTMGRRPPTGKRTKITNQTDMIEWASSWCGKGKIYHPYPLHRLDSMLWTMTTTLIILSALLIPCLLIGFWGHQRLPILMYHKVRPAPGDSLTVPLDDFKSQLDYLAAKGYQSISFDDMRSASAQLPPKPVLLTFDDAYADFESYALEAMQERGFKATVFLPVGHIGGTNVWDGGDEPLMGWDDVRRLSTGPTEFGLHSWNHDNYRDLDLEAMRKDLQRCREKLNDERITFVDVLAYPYGGFPRTEPMRSQMKALFQSMGIHYAVRIGSRIERIAPRDPHEVTRVGIQSMDQGLRFKLKLMLGKTRL